MEHGSSPVAQYLRDMAQVHTADLGCRVFYTTAPHNAFDTHAVQLVAHAGLWTDLFQAVGDFYDDLREHDAGDNVVVMLFTEFGRRVRDNGSGTRSSS